MNTSNVCIVFIPFLNKKKPEISRCYEKLALNFFIIDSNGEFFATPKKFEGIHS